MKSVSHHISSALLAVAGLAIFGLSTAALNRSGNLASDRNPFAIQQSAYGKLLARMSETTIDRVWHMGIEQVTPHGVGGCGGCESGACGHDHGPGETCNHGDGADSITFHVDDDGNVEEESNGEDEHPTDHSKSADTFTFHVDDEENADLESNGEDEHSADYGDSADTFTFHLDDEGNTDEESNGEDEHEHTEACDHDHAPGEICNHDKTTDSATNGFKPLGTSPKEWLQNASIVRFRRTNPKSLSDRHLMEVKKDVEQMLLRSYKMDPSHYGAYNSYHLFLTTHEFGGTDHTRLHAKKIAEHTLQLIARENEDPEAWLTAAAAATNLYFLESGDNQETDTKMPLESLKKHRGRIAFCLSQFAALQETALNNGTWDGIPVKRQLEIESRSRFALKTFEQFDAMIARAEPRPAPITEGEVVGGITIP